MGQKATILIMSVLFGLGIFAAYHSDNQNSSKNKVMHVEYQGMAKDNVLEKSKELLAKELADEGIEVKAIVFKKIL